MLSERVGPGVVTGGESTFDFIGVVVQVVTLEGFTGRGKRKKDEQGLESVGEIPVLGTPTWE